MLSFTLVPIFENTGTSYAPCPGYAISDFLSELPVEQEDEMDRDLPDDAIFHISTLKWSFKPGLELCLWLLMVSTYLCPSSFGSRQPPNTKLASMGSMP